MNYPSDRDLIDLCIDLMADLETTELELRGMRKRIEAVSIALSERYNSDQD